MPHGEFAWNELLTRDVERAKAFYAAVLGWTYESFDIGGGSYWVAMAGDVAVGGIGPIESGAIQTTQSYWFSTIEVDNVDERVAAAVQLGAAVLQEPQDVPNVGRFAVIRDPNGAALGLMTGVQPTEQT